MDLVNENDAVLDEEALLRVATLVKDAAQKEVIYKKAIAKFESPRAQYNLAALYLKQGKDDKAEDYLKGLQEDADVLNAQGVLALHQDKLAAAEDAFRRAGTPAAQANLGVVLILTGRYEEALNVLKDTQGCPHNTVLAYLLTDQPEAALQKATCQDPKVWYLKAIAAARLGKADDVKACLEKAFANPDLKERAARDIELAGYEF